MRQPAKRKKKVNLKQTAFTRFMLIIAVFVLWIGGIGARLVHLQITQHDWLTKECEERTKTRTRSRQLRGSIFASDGRAIAMSTRVKTLFADATEISDINAT